MIDALFKIGPARAESPLGEGDLEPYERRRGIEFEPWQAELLVEMSKAYLYETHEARNIEAPCPWDEMKETWHRIRNARTEKQWDRVRPQPEGAKTKWPSSATSRSA